MDIPTLKWFTDCAAQDPHAPAAVKLLAKKIRIALFKPNDDVTINRAFKISNVTGSHIRTWMTSGAYQATPEIADLAKKCIYAFDLVDQGVLASKAWGIRGKRGPKHGFSKTLGGAAIANQLSKVMVTSALPDDLFGSENLTGEELLSRIVLGPDGDEEPLFSKAQALDHASTIAGVRADEIKNQKGIEPGFPEDEANLALSEILKSQKETYASRLIDLEDLKEAGRR